MPAQITYRSRQSMFLHRDVEPRLSMRNSTPRPRRYSAAGSRNSGEGQLITPSGPDNRHETLVHESPAADPSYATVVGGNGVLENTMSDDGASAVTSDDVPLFEDTVIAIGTEHDDLGSDGGPDMRRRSLNVGEDLSRGETTPESAELTQSRGYVHRLSIDVVGGDNVEAYENREVLNAGSGSGHDRNGRGRSRSRGVSLGGSVARSGLSRKFVRSLLRHICLRADSRQREDLRSMVETLKIVANQPGVDMKQELKREAVSLLGPELAREAFEASLTETRNELLRQRTIAAATASATAVSAAVGGAQAAATAAAEAGNRDLELSTMMTDGVGRGDGVSSASSDSVAPGGSISATRSSAASGVGGARRLSGVQSRRSTHPHPRKRKSFGIGSGVDSDGEDVGTSGVAAPPFYLMPEEEVEQRLRAIHKGPQHEDFHLCCICMDRTRDATLIHGKTAHQACCYDCASELFEQGLPCPCCRQPISCVVRNYL